MDHHSILVVDDEADFLESIGRGLTISGYVNFRLISDPVEAAELLESGVTCDIALIDITLSGVSGIEVLERIKSLSPTTACIMITAIDEVGTARECREKGACDYLVKPFSREDLVLSIQRALEMSRLATSESR